MILKTIYNLIYDFYRGWVKYVKRACYRGCLGYCGKNVDLRFDRNPGNLSRVYLYDNTNIFQGFRFISVTGKFIMKENSGAAQGLTVITGNHRRIKNMLYKEICSSHEYDIEQDVVVSEDVWIGANVTLLAGVMIGRGATIGSGSVVRNNVPPYAIVIGNPAKIIGFSFTPEEVVEHELSRYKEEERLELDLLEKNYNKYFLKRTKEIKNFSKI